MALTFEMPDSPAKLGQLLQEALRLHQAGRLGEAETCYRQILTQQPKHPDALHYLGLLAYQRGDYETAANLIGESVGVQDDSPAAYSNLGNALAMLGRFADAEAAFRNASRVDPQFADALFNLGNILRQQQKLADAEDAYRRVVARHPGHVGALNNLGNLLYLRGRAQEAADAFLLLGDVLQGEGRSQDAAAAYRQSLAILPNPGVEVKLAFLIPTIYRSVAEIDVTRERLRERIAALRAANVKLAEPLRYASSAIFYTGYHGRNDRELRRGFADFYLDASPDLGWRAPHCGNYAGPGEKIRIGVISRFLRPEHPIGKHFGAIVDCLDRSRFEVVTFRVDLSGGAQPGENAQLTLPGHDLEATRRAVAEARLDVLFYPDIGMEPITYFLAFSRLAPVQCVTFGHPVTTGIPNVDYFLSADVFEPADADAHYSETLVRLANIPSYFKRRLPAGAAPAREDFGLPADARLYVCVQNPIKFHPEFDAVVAEILRRDPKGLLVLFNGNRTERWGQLLLERFRQTMPDVANRVVFLPFLEIDAFLRFLQHADAVLDTPHFSGGTTSYELFAMGVPIVTWPGAFARSRQTYALYRQMQVAGPVAESASHYVELALRLAQDPSWRTLLQSQLRQQCHVLYENVEAVRELERFFAAAVAAAAQSHLLQGWPR